MKAESGKQKAESCGSSIVVEVTAEDIESGWRGDCSLCPLALAFQRIPGFNRARVSSARVYPRPTESIRLPYPAQEFIRAFDAGVSVQPFSFTLEVPLPA
jgi:hypothetical protein